MRLRISSASSSLRQMWQAGLLIRHVAGKGRRASLYTPISRKEYQ
jgi:predicted transcriptional regulator